MIDEFVNAKSRSRRESWIRRNPEISEYLSDMLLMRDLHISYTELQELKIENPWMVDAWEIFAEREQDRQKREVDKMLKEIKARSKKRR